MARSRYYTEAYVSGGKDVDDLCDDYRGLIADVKGELESDVSAVFRGFRSDIEFLDEFCEYMEGASNRLVHVYLTFWDEILLDWKKEGKSSDVVEWMEKWLRDFEEDWLKDFDDYMGVYKDEGETEIRDLGKEIDDAVKNIVRLVGLCKSNYEAFMDSVENTESSR